ncbi:hypothetical protein ABK040_006321 [Willaertia magna]
MSDSDDEIMKSETSSVEGDDSSQVDNDEILAKELESEDTENVRKSSRNRALKSYKEESSSEEENKEEEEEHVEEETKVRSRRNRGKARKNYNEDEAFKAIDEMEDDNIEEFVVDENTSGRNTTSSDLSTSEVPKRQRRLRRNIDSNNDEEEETPSRIRRRGGRKTKASEDKLPKKQLRQRSKKVNYAEEDMEDDEEEENQEEEEEVEEVQVRSRRGQAKRKVVDSDEEAMEDEEEEENEDEEEGNEENQEENEENVENEQEEESFIEETKDDVVETILACREVKDDSEDENEEEKVNQESTSQSEPKTVVQYLCKYKDKSYMHCEWVAASEIEDDPTVKSKLKSFLKKYPDPVKAFEGVEEYFPPEYTEVERIIAKSTFQKKTIYLVKWKILPYNEATWEFEDRIEDKEKIEQFIKFNKVPSAVERRIPKRPPPNAFKKLEESPKFKNENQLREYQLEGLNWLVFCWYQRRSSILADEMGLGKTVQTVATIEYLRVFEHIRGPFLIIAPLSTIEHWKREFEAWTEMNVFVFHGNQASRDVMKHHEFYFTDAKGKQIKNVYKFNAMITTYEVILSESSCLSKIPWQYLVVDEGHRLKNQNSKLMLSLKKFSAVHKLLLTGTPLQNNLQELFSLLHFLDPDTFDDPEDFARQYGDLKNSDELEKLHTLISPYLLRRLKEDVEKSIPPKEEIVVEVVPTNTQKMYYKAILDKNKEFLMRGASKASNMPRLINVLMEVRKVCNHPFLVAGAEEAITKGMSDKDINEELIKSSSKLILVDKLLKKLKEGGHKVLIFSQMVQVLNILEDYMRYKGYSYVRLDGTIRGTQRQAAIDKFSDESQNVFVFLVSTRAGGVGINLTAADTVIIYDSDWNPQNDLQAQARCHRIGQTKEVKVYRLLTKNTKEKDMFERASMKLGLDRAVLSTNNEFVQSTKGGASKIGLEKEEIDLLLRHGAYSAFKDDSEDQQILMEGDIDTIMERNATVVRYDQPTSAEPKGLSNFSKATFCFSQSDMEVDIDDENFWQKMLPGLKNAEGLMNKLSEEKSFKTKEQQDQYMADVKALVDAKLQEMDKFKYKPDEELANLLTQIVYSRIIDSRHRDTAQKWLEVLEQPRLRNGTSRDEESEGDDEEVTSSKSSSKKKSMSAIGGWYKAERQRFQKVFLAIGWGKWERIQEEKLHSHTIEEIHSFAECFVSQLATLVESEKDVEFLNSLIESSAVPDSNKSEGESSDLLKTEPADKVNAGQSIKVYLPKEELGNASLEIIKVAPQQPRVTKKKRGKRAVNLCVRFYEITDEEKEKGSVVIASPGFKGQFSIRINYDNGSKNSNTFDVVGVHPILEDKEWIDQAKRGGKNWVKKLKFALQLGKVLDILGGKLKVEDVPKLGIKAPADWWDRDCDRDLLLGYMKHGYAKFDDMKEDSELCFKTKHDDHMSKAKSRKEKKDASSWPTVALVNKRANKLIEFLVKEKNISIASSTLSLTESNGNGTASSSSDNQITISDKVTEGWSKREKKDLVRALLVYGTYPEEVTGEPNWVKLISAANLKKSENAVKSFFPHLIQTAEQAAGEDDTEEEGSKTKKEDKKKKTEQEIAPGTAKKLLQSIELMNKLYTTVYPNFEECVDKLAYLKVSGLPRWWKGKEHDRQLVKGVKKHGFDFKAIFSDKEFKFAAKKETKTPPREGILFTRLSNIVELCEKVNKLGSPTKSKQMWNFTPKKTHVLLKSPPVHEKKADNGENEKKAKRKVKRSVQTTLDFNNTKAGDEDDPIEEFEEKPSEKEEKDEAMTEKESVPPTNTSSLPTTLPNPEDVLRKKIPKKKLSPMKQKEENVDDDSVKRKRGDAYDEKHSENGGSSSTNIETPTKDKKRKTTGSSPADSLNKHNSPYHISSPNNHHDRERRSSGNYRDNHDDYHRNDHHSYHDRDRDNYRSSRDYRDRDRERDYYHRR